jgi:hypothetical protein
MHAFLRGVKKLTHVLLVAVTLKRDAKKNFLVKMNEDIFRGKYFAILFHNWEISFAWVKTNFNKKSV